MTPRWERSPEAPELGDNLFMDAVLRPHRSLSRIAFKVMFGVVLLANAGLALVFLSQGALPVAAFFGLDVLALWFAFHLNYRSGRVAEFVRVAPGAVHVSSVNADGAAKHWVLNPVWARVARDGPGVVIRTGKDQMRLGAFMPPEECESFASALDSALFRAKRGY